MSHDVFARIAHYRIVPVIAIDALDAALPLADALIAGGLPLAEITFRTAAAAAVIQLLTRERPDMLIGAGTVLSAATAREARARGAEFAVAPGTNPAVVAAAREAGLPFIPGVATASEVEQALSLGATMQKFFPSEANGGVAMLKALIAPYAHTGVQFMPTGGVTPDNLPSYLALKPVAAVGGTWLATKDDIAAGRWAQITEKCRAACALLAAS